MNLDHLREWIGRSQSDTDTLDLRQAQLLAATVDYPTPLALGDALPPLWHWVYFLTGSPAAGLGLDGHPARGGLLPPVPLQNRMWAGGRVFFAAPILLGQTLRKTSTVLDVQAKSGKSGDLVFVTVEHALFNGEQRVLREEHDIVYRNPGAAAPAKAPQTIAAPVLHSLTPTTTTLFRYSALTFNGHRIHYDADYCRTVEGYDHCVIHGPLNATLLAQCAAQIAAAEGQTLSEFHYRGVAPATLGQTLTYAATGEHELTCFLGNGHPCMQATWSAR
jgi:3-methylfumaryl-CoA hydratase